MRLTVLGKSPAWEDAGGACSGYLVEEGDTRLLLDCGNGVFSKLRHHSDYTLVDAVVVSHLHADHFLDLVPYAYALTYSPRQQRVAVGRWPGTERPAHPSLLAPPGAGEFFRRLVGAWGNDDLIEAAFELDEYGEESELAFDDIRLRFQRVPHPAETYAMRLESVKGGGCIVYGADTSPSDALPAFARGCDLLLLEGTLPSPDAAGSSGHLTPREAGEHARAAGAKRLVVIHISDELDPDWAREEASAGFGAPAELAREGAVYEV